MLARRRKLKLRNGIQVDLPLLVPSFSSKGFKFKRSPAKKKRYSLVSNDLATQGPTITGAILLSAYDIFYENFISAHSYLKGKEIVFIDSGAYELSPEYDSTEPKHDPRLIFPAKQQDQQRFLKKLIKDLPATIHRPFSEEDYRVVLRKLKKDLPIVIPNFDADSMGKTIKEQVVAAQTLFKDFPNHTRNFIIKPTQKKSSLDIDDIIGHVNKLPAFDIVGVTEKELGTNLLDRLKNIAKLRAAMDREKIDLPIHVWGGLDPIITPLYFFVGAEIFDGVSWLRYAYHKGMAIYRDCHSVIELSIENSLDRARQMTLTKNLIFLEDLATRLREFVDKGAESFGMFDSQEEAFGRAYRTLATKIPELKGEEHGR